MALSHPPFVGNVRIQQAARNAPAMKTGEKDAAAVKILQASLIDLGYKMPVSTRRTGLPDGIFGRETADTVYQFQVDKKLKGRDGIAGKETLTKLDQLLSPVPPPPPLPPPKPPLPTTRDYKIGVDDPSITPDPGAGPWNSKPKTMETRVQKELILEASRRAGPIIGADAGNHMLHYLDNSGRTFTIDLEGMVSEVPTAKKRFEDEVNQAKRYVEMLPEGTHMITSVRAEAAYNRQSESRNWYFAVGGYSTWGKGTAAVKNGPARREYMLEFEYKFYDRYNWDTGKQVEIFGITITDHFMGEFHRQGLAREFDMVGSIKKAMNWRHGAAIPPEQYLPSGGR
jgi:hypothetical protein